MISVDNELLRVSVEAVAGATLRYVLRLYLCRTAVVEKPKECDAYIAGHYIECVLKLKSTTYSTFPPSRLFPDNELPDYTMVMLANNKTMLQVNSDNTTG